MQQEQGNIVRSWTPMDIDRWTKVNTKWTPHEQTIKERQFCHKWTPNKHTDTKPTSSV